MTLSQATANKDEHEHLHRFITFCLLKHGDKPGLQMQAFACTLFRRSRPARESTCVSLSQLQEQLAVLLAGGTP